MQMINNETVASLLEELGMEATHTSPSLNSLAAASSRYLKDMKLNLTSMLASRNLTKKEGYLLALSVAISQRHDLLTMAFDALAKREGATDEEVGETHACASVMAVNNMFYRFRHYMHDAEYYNRQPAGLRMSVLMNPVMGKGLFELMSLVISAVNGCERCVTSHERSVKEHGADEPRIYDAIRLGAVVKGLCVAM